MQKPHSSTSSSYFKLLAALVPCAVPVFNRQQNKERQRQPTHVPAEENGQLLHHRMPNIPRPSPEFTLQGSSGQQHLIHSPFCIVTIGSHYSDRSIPLLPEETGRMSGTTK
jgi:hypothetical protein